MIDIKLLRNNPELVKENIKKKFQDEKLPLVDEVVKLDEEYRAIKTKADTLRNRRNSISKEIGAFLAKGLNEQAIEAKRQVEEIAQELETLKEQEYALSKELMK